jgi:cytoskeletal protein CcmA (bactofilin family)
MIFKKASKPQSRIDTLIGAETSISGDVTFSGGLRIDGQIKGNVRASGEQSSTLVISEHATIEGEISVPHLVINGTVIGPVTSSGFVELQAKARVTGDLEYNAIEMHLGAVVQGRLVHAGQLAKSVELKLAASSN